ncbi:MAG: tetratricopeptide repeat protein [Rikenellaceae bacterium]|nr:tetratricopeptide repeat protein [Rikenellaceae bacterium]
MNHYTKKKFLEDKNRRNQKPEIVPQGDDTFRIDYPAFYRDDIRSVKSADLAGAYAAKLSEIIDKTPYNFEAVLLLTDFFTDNGMIEKACEMRFDACQRIIELLPEDEEVELSWNVPENHTLIFLLNYSAIDHFLAGEFGISSALLETCLDVDPEDHMECSKILSYCYVALKDEDSFRAEIINIDPKDMERALLELWASFRFTGRIDDKQLLDFVRSYPFLFEELTAESHHADEQFIAETDSGKMSRQAKARQIWLKTEPLWERFGDFIDILKTGVGKFKL